MGAVSRGRFSRLVDPGRATLNGTGALVAPAFQERPMKTRHVYSTTDIDQARAAMAAARGAGVGDDCLTLVARSDIELDAIPNKDKEASGDFMHGAMKGVAAGGTTGLLLGLAAMVLAPIGVTRSSAPRPGAWPARSSARRCPTRCGRSSTTRSPPGAS
jgi:hypothetical protein